MTLPDRILAITDLSTPARQAALRAAMLSRETGARLDLLHVVASGPLERMRALLGGGSADQERRVLAVAHEKLSALGGALRVQYDVDPGTRVTVGSVVKEVGQEMGAGGNALVVCGARGESTVRHFVLGTTASRLLHTAVCSTLVVKQQPHEPYRHLLIPVDFSPSSQRAIALARAIAPEAEVTLMHAFEAPFEGHMRYASVDEDAMEAYRHDARREAQARLRALRDDCGLQPGSCNLVLAHGNPALRIVQQELESGADLVVVGKHGETLLEEMFLGSVSKHVLTECQGDVLVVV